jgi:hypothetical protein
MPALIRYISQLSDGRTGSAGRRPSEKNRQDHIMGSNKKICDWTIILELSSKAVTNRVDAVACIANDSMIIMTMTSTMKFMMMKTMVISCTDNKLGEEEGDD